MKDTYSLSESEVTSFFDDDDGGGVEDGGEMGDVTHSGIHGNLWYYIPREIII